MYRIVPSTKKDRERVYVEHFIHLMQDNPTLWYKDHPEYRNTVQRTLAWNSILNEMIGTYSLETLEYNEGLKLSSIPEMKKRWKNLVATYKRLRRMAKGDNAAEHTTPTGEVVSPTTWPYYPMLKFLDVLGDTGGGDFPDDSEGSGGSADAAGQGGAASEAGPSTSAGRKKSSGKSKGTWVKPEKRPYVPGGGLMKSKWKMSSFARPKAKASSSASPVSEGMAEDLLFARFLATQMSRLPMRQKLFFRQEFLSKVSEAVLDNDDKAAGRSGGDNAAGSNSNNMGASNNSNMGASNSSNMGASNSSNMGASNSSNMGPSNSANMGASNNRNIGPSNSSNMSSNNSSSISAPTGSNMNMSNNFLNLDQHQQQQQQHPSYGNANMAMNAANLNTVHDMSQNHIPSEHRDRND